MTDSQRGLRNLPAVGALLEREDVGQWIAETSRPAVVAALREAIEEARQRVLSGAAEEETPDDVVQRAESILRAAELPSLRRVINATGIVLHTGLGRAPLSEAAVRAIADSAGAYCNLEFDLDSGGRGKRQRHVSGLICRLTGAEAATVVNNNAAATSLILRTLAHDREVVVSRGQLVEIGGSYRLPDIMAASGARLREVGTTNRTRIEDYAAAIGDETALLMRVHTSNYRVVGFTAEVPIADIAELAHQYNLPAVDDLGSGALCDLSDLDLPPEPWVQASLEAGADVVCFSGDKLLGGPQCGIICGRRELIDRIEANPLMRTYRVGKLTLLALEATLRQYIDSDGAARNVPALAMLGETGPVLAARAEVLCQKLSAALPGEKFLECSDVSFAGGGALPAEALETVVVQWRPSSVAVDEVVTRLRSAPTPVVARVRDEAVVFDVRTLHDTELDAVADAARLALYED